MTQTNDNMQTIPNTRSNSLVPSPSPQVHLSFPHSPHLPMFTKTVPHLVWKTGGLFDEEGLPAEMQVTDIGQMLGHHPNDIGTIMSMIGVDEPSPTDVGNTVDWSAVSENDTKKSLRVKCFKMPFSTEAVKRPASPCHISDLDLPADVLQRLIAESGVLDDLGVGSLPTPPPIVENPMRLLSSPFHSHLDHSTYVKKRRLSSSDSVFDDCQSSVIAVSSIADADGRDDKYLERRRKNNIASRRSRETRKRKMETMEQRADDLEKENKTLRARVEELERTTRLMKELLLQRLGKT